ncbi:MAG: DNA internalization-related competence protein ComEC/Rec2 [Deltaproteobacteria bacterium]|nr:DNA internalization-related competence protein ComEC/Rec2 [Deltaproteobacteria bacterium]MBW2129781.1 DNA internalization-related competence protein ComEC/Rec2 [Deltaproteobacteria bacterium]MBW2302497.1 DNA internalization-related competence protein ComEC/Rec2 [Deltaproteobacteria bacterium]
MARRPLVPLLAAFLGGILTAHSFPAKGDFTTLAAAGIFTITLAGLLFLRSSLKFPAFLVLFYLAGMILDLQQHRESVLAGFAKGRPRIILEGVVLEPPRCDDKTSKFPLMVEQIIFPRTTPLTLHEKVLVTIYRDPPGLAPGDRIRFPAGLRSFRNFNNPGGFDYVSYMENRGFACSASVSNGRFVVPMGRGSLGFVGDVAEWARRPLREFFRAHLLEEQQVLFRALILGERQDLTAEVREPFIRSGLGHVLAVSGLHIGLIAWLFFKLTIRVLSFSYRLTLKWDLRRAAALMTALPVILYGGLAGFQVSAQRAMIMVLAYLFSLVIKREKEVWSTLALAAMVVLAINPHALFSISFQFSFGAVVGILWLGPRLHERLNPFQVSEGKSPKIRSFFASISLHFIGLTAVSIAATLFLAPLTVFYFHRISLVAIPANLTVVPLLGFWILPSGLLAALFFPFLPSVSILFLALASRGIDWAMRITEFWARFSWADLWVITPNLFELAVLYGFLFCLFSIKGRKWAKVSLVALGLLLVADAGYWIHRTRFNPDLKITFLDVGQGNAALIQFPGKERMLIDGGGFPRSSFNIGKMVLAPFLLRSKIRRIDYLVLSHPQSDHMNGLRFIASHFHPREFWYNGDRVKTPSFAELMEIISKRRIPIRLPSDLTSPRNISGVRTEILHPEPEGQQNQASFPPSRDLNNRSLVVKLSYEGISCLFPGDIEEEGEKVLVSRRGSRLRSDILLVPHHGSRASCTDGFLREVNPRVCVISCGSGNFFGFPHPELLRRLMRAGCRILRTDCSGAIVLETAGGRIQAMLQKGMDEK